MLLELSIHNYILVEDATISFQPGLNVLTGETGAGKSMILGALGLLMGKTASKDHVRQGKDRARVAAVFDGVETIFETFSVPEDENLILSREIKQDGKSVARINGMPVSLQILKKVAEQLIHIHGQNEQLELFDRNYRLDMLDAYSGHGLVPEIAHIYGLLSEKKAKLRDMTENAGQRETRMDYLRFQMNEIEAAMLKEGEDEELEERYKYLTSLEKVIEVAGAANDYLEGEMSASSVVSDIASRFRKLEGLDEDLRHLSSLAGQADQVMAEFSRAVGKYLDSLPSDGEEIRDVERRLDVINTLKRKFGTTVAAILAEKDAMSAELEELDHMETHIADLQLEIEKLQVAYDSTAAALTMRRKEAALDLEKEVQNQLPELNMKEARLEIEVAEAQPSAKGNDDVNLLISTAVGHPLRDIKKVVSGGELSRLMLAIQVVTGGAPCMIFDEVDAGISGSTANVVGEKLYTLAGKSQLVCITHLPQIAAFADHHLLIEKTSDEVQTTTDVRVLSESERVEEISRLVGGTQRSEITNQHAKEVLESAHKKMKVLRTI